MAILMPTLIDIVENGRKWRLTQELALAGLAGLEFAHLLEKAKINGNMFVYHFKHNGAKSMFEMKKERIKEQMRAFYKEHLNELKEERIVFNDICGQFDIQLPKQEVKEDDTTLIYEERSNGNFIIPCGMNPKIANTRREIMEMFRSSQESK